MVSWSISFGSWGKVETLKQVVGLIGVLVGEEGGYLRVVKLCEFGVSEATIRERAVDLLLAAELVKIDIPW